MKLHEIIRSINFPFKTLTFILMFSGLAVSMIAINFLPKMLPLAYASYAIMFLSASYLCFNILKAGYKKQAICYFAAIAVILLLGCYVLSMFL